MTDYINDLLKQTDKLIKAMNDLERNHRLFPTIKFRLKKEAGEISDLILACRRSISFACDDPAYTAFYEQLEEMKETLMLYHKYVRVRGGLCSSDKYRIKRTLLRELINSLTAQKAALETVYSAHNNNSQEA